MPNIHRKRNKPLGVIELIAIALGGMIGGGIFSVLGVSVALIGVYTPIAFMLGGALAFLAAYSYVKLAVYYKDEGATYSFFKKTFPNSEFAASLVGWWITFGYISTLALYAYTFSSYAISGFEVADSEYFRKIVAGLIIFVFALINIWSVKGMGKIEDVMVYTKLFILALISFVFINNSKFSIPILMEQNNGFNIMNIAIVASLTFVAFEGFQLVIHAINEMENPRTNIPRAIYSSIFVTISIYVVIAIGAIMAIPFENIIQSQEYALASGAGEILGEWGAELVIIGAVLATSSAISGTLFGASRLMSVIANDGYFPKFLTKRKNNIPIYSIVLMAIFAFILILLGDLKVILEFGSVTFLLVSILMAFANLKIHRLTNSSLILTIVAFLGLLAGTIIILYYEATTNGEQIYYIGALYAALTLLAYIFTYKRT